ncbi:MAG TPA: PIG-L family deacetylase [Acidimicrobiales bacterium]|nr:PIG-L family deacetylase [Acidimicrobiales bacterium]
MSFADWADLPGDDVLQRIVVVSPHFDDAVQGAGLLLARHPGATVLTVFGGPPAAYPDPPSEWDALGGFASGDDVVALRRDEDVAALAVVGAAPRWLDFVDHQYLDAAARATADDVAAALRVALTDLAPTAIFVPFGLGNPDHDLTHAAARLLLDEFGDVAWYCYEDAGYKHIPGLLAWRISALFRSGWWPTPAVVPIDDDLARRTRALQAYASQIPPLQRDHLLDDRLDANLGEQHWRLARPLAGWEGLSELPG